MRFIVFGDSKGKENGINKKVLKTIMNETCNLDPKPEFIVMCGDTVAGSNKKDLLAFQLNNLKDLIYKYHPKIPLIPVIGNHEVNIEPIDDRFEKIFSQIYSNLIFDNSLEGYNNTVYYKDFGNTRIIVLNAFHYGSIHKIDKKQLNWFEEVASVNKDSKLIFVHSPAFPTGAHLGHCLDLYPEERDIFWKIVNNCRIDIVFSGHEHNYSRRLIGNIYQIIAGGGGEKLRDKYNSKYGVVVAPIDVYHFLVVDVKINSIKVAAISSKGKILDEFEIDKTTISC